MSCKYLHFFFLKYYTTQYLEIQSNFVPSEKKALTIFPFCRIVNVSTYTIFQITLSTTFERTTILCRIILKFIRTTLSPWR